MKTLKPNKKRHQREGSFTLIETVVALALVAFLIMEVGAVQGNSIVFSEYSRNVTQASWLARRILSQVEYYWRTKPFTELEQVISAVPFEGSDEYQYAIEIKPWDFPLLQLLNQVLLGGGSEDDDDKAKTPEDGGMAQMMEQAVKQIFGDEPKFMTVKVEVSWAEGAQRNSTSLTYLLTNQAKLDEFIATLRPEWERATKPSAKPIPTKPDPNQPNANQPNANQPDANRPDDNRPDDNRPDLDQNGDQRR